MPNIALNNPLFNAIHFPANSHIKTAAVGDTSLSTLHIQNI